MSWGSNNKQANFYFDVMPPPDPRARLTTLAFKGGTVTGTRGLMDYLFPTRIPSWLPNGGSGIGKRPFGSKRADNRAAGRLLKLVLREGGTFSVRITSTDTAFLKAFLGDGRVNNVLQVYTEAGTIYGPQYSSVALSSSDGEGEELELAYPNPPAS